LDYVSNIGRIFLEAWLLFGPTQLNETRKTMKPTHVVLFVICLSGCFEPVRDSAPDSGNTSSDAGESTGGGSSAGGTAVGGGDSAGGGSTANGGGADSNGGGSAGGIQSGGGFTSLGGGTAGGQAGGTEVIQLTLTSNSPAVYVSLPNIAPLTATLTRNGAPVPNELIQFSSTLGAIGVPGSMGAMTYSGLTNNLGVISFQFAEAGSTGTATISASALGEMASTTVRISTVRLKFVELRCGTNLCSILGIKSSGFQESAIVKFQLKDEQNNPVSFIPVNFSSSTPLLDVNIIAFGMTDSMGFVDTTVRSGLAVGSFYVEARLTSGPMEAISDEIGVRGAKPSNYGFRLECSKMNLAAYVSPMPPLSLPTQCFVELLDRYGNRVGKIEPVGLKSEAGSVASTIVTTAYMPGSQNLSEGRGQFVFSTVGPFPAKDVTPLLSGNTQYPSARMAEPSRMLGPLILNPRDGLVTIIAYVRGEEHFFDDNNNGTRDANERFIDQGEPFLDLNDDNIWNPGEFFIDDNPSDNTWNGPNGIWDSNTTIWTQTHILYTGPSDPTVATFSPATFDVSKDSNTLIEITTPDARLNILESGSTVTTQFTGSKGSAQLVSATVNMVDGYGFQLRSRELVNSTGTGPCNAQSPICTYKTLFGTWNPPNAQMRVTGAPLTDMTPPANASVTVQTSVRGSVGQAIVSGVIQ
jgi:hypothetical protein